MSRAQSMILGCFTLLVFLGMLFFVDPAFVQNVGWHTSYLPFFILLTLVCFWFLWAITRRWKRSLLWSFVTLVYVWLRVNQLDLLWNNLLLVSFGLIWEYYWHLTRPL